MFVLKTFLKSFCFTFLVNGFKGFNNEGMQISVYVMKIMDKFLMKCMVKILCQVPPNSKVLTKEVIRDDYIYIHQIMV